MTLKPVLKWVGGKTQILERILAKFPVEIHNYYEPFVGGGAVLFGLLDAISEGRIVVRGDIKVSDINKGLIGFYLTLRDSVDELVVRLGELMRVFREIGAGAVAAVAADAVNRNPQNEEEARQCQENYYYWIRQKYNSAVGDSVDLAAMFLFLNKTGFRGMHREGPHGFNVPFGNYVNPTVYSEEELRGVSAAIKDVEFSVADFEDVLSGVGEGDFVYMDPPYMPVDAKSFVKYNKDGFDRDKHKRLFELCLKKNMRVLMSNSDVTGVINGLPGFSHEKIECRRAINSKNPGAVAGELLLWNY